MAAGLSHSSSDSAPSVSLSFLPSLLQRPSLSPCPWQPLSHLPSLWLHNLPRKNSCWCIHLLHLTSFEFPRYLDLQLHEGSKVGHHSYEIKPLHEKAPYLDPQRKDWIKYKGKGHCLIIWAVWHGGYGCSWTRRPQQVVIWWGRA